MVSGPALPCWSTLRPGLPWGTWFVDVATSLFKGVLGSWPDPVVVPYVS